MENCITVDFKSDFPCKADSQYLKALKIYIKDKCFA